jgi:glycosyltransferase involved in cell wall biosynthesis
MNHSPNNNIKLSVIIPVYNKSTTIQRALDSVKTVGRNDIEYIVIDDSSTDDSRNVIKDLCKKYKDIVPIFNDRNMGAGASRNIGIQRATGEYIFFLDADDHLNGSALSQVIQCADEHAADLVRGKIEGLKVDGSRQNLAKEYLLHNELKTGARWHNEESLWFYWYFTSNLYRRSFLNKNYIKFPEGVRNEDPLFLCKCYLHATSIVLHPSTTYFYHISETQQKRAGVDFYRGWIHNYYAIFQLIRTQIKQKAFFLCQFPSLEKHCKSITDYFEKENAIDLLNYISIIYSRFDEDRKYFSDYLVRLSKFIKPWQKKEIDSTIEFARMISGRSATNIYNILK